jgi:phosphotriesterase-related protein
LLSFMKEQKYLHRVLISHDAGWYEPDKPDGGQIRGYTTVFKKLIPALKKTGFTQKDIEQVFRRNPAQAFTVTIRKA